MAHPFQVMLEAMPVLAMVLVIVMLPLLSDGPPGNDRRAPRD
jgi:hypothetical protein